MVESGDKESSFAICAPLRTISAYKHINPDIVERFLTGESIQLGSLSYYREMQDTDRRDHTEGYAIQRVDGLIGPDCKDRNRIFSGLNMIVDCDATIHFHDSKLLQPNYDHYIFCCSRLPDHERCKKTGEVIVEIANLQAFAAQIGLAHRQLGKCWVGPVSYTKTEGDYIGDECQPFSPFLKPKAKDWEDEFRIIYERRYSAEPYVRLAAPNTAQFLRLHPME